MGSLLGRGKTGPDLSIPINANTELYKSVQADIKAEAQ
jgi:hypothetical protein